MDRDDTAKNKPSDEKGKVAAAAAAAAVTGNYGAAMAALLKAREMAIFVSAGLSSTKL